MSNHETSSTTDFIRQIIEEDLASGKHDTIITRFPPEPNGYLHIGHAKSLCINFGLAEYYADFTPKGARTHLRFDDTNPTKEEQKYIDAIKKDIRWLGFDWDGHEYYASDYFGQLYEWALQLVKQGKAFVCDLTAEQIREYRGTLTEPGQNSPWRDRPVEENLDLFKRMKNGEFPDGSRTLRARIDMSSPNLNLRDPVMYRILHAEHPRTGNEWCIYPMYDWAHGQSDSIEHITHSICTLEFEDLRPLYDWFCEALGIYHPQQIEFARGNLTYIITSKRYLLKLVKEKVLSGWDDPRMPTLAGYRRRGYTPESIRAFWERVGLAKKKSVVDIALLEYCLREELNKKAPRVMAVLNPLKVVIDNYPEDQVEQFEIINNPEDPNMGTRKLPFSRELYIEREDFREDPPRKFFRLAPGREVRLKRANLITCTSVVKDVNTGEIIELHCTYDPETRGGSAPDGRKVKGTLHWVSAPHALDAETRLYDRLLTVPIPAEEDDFDGDFMKYLNPDSLVTLTGCKVEPNLAGALTGDRVQFFRHGYFCVDSDSQEGNLVFNRTVPLRDTWAKIEKQLKQAKKK